jgi:hypothetical protein
VPLKTYSLSFTLGRRMTTYQQRISFKGSEDSIDYFTNLLREAKEISGANSADILLSAAGQWLAR